MCTSDLEEISMGLGWTFTTTFTIFLDATCMAIDFDNTILSHVDYSTKSILDDSIHHSGDVINSVQKSGEHTININLKRIPKNVASLFFIISGWTTTIDAVKSPWVRLTNNRDKAELCRYTLEQAGKHRAVIMCRLYRENISNPWKVVAIGTLGAGCASDYAPIKTNIQEYLKNLSKNKK